MTEETGHQLDDATYAGLQVVVKHLEESAGGAKTLAKNAQRTLLTMVLTVIALFLVFEGYVRPFQDRQDAERRDKQRQEYIGGLEDRVGEAQSESDIAASVLHDEERKTEIIAKEARSAAAEVLLGLQNELQGFLAALPETEENIEDVSLLAQGLPHLIDVIRDGSVTDISQIDLNQQTIRPPTRADVDLMKPFVYVISRLRTLNVGAVRDLERRLQLFAKNSNAAVPSSRLGGTIVDSLAKIERQGTRVSDRLSFERTAKMSQSEKFRQLASAKDDVSKALSALPESPLTSDQWTVVKESVLRIGAVLLVLYLSQVLVSYSRYHFRVSDHLFAQARALDIAIRSGSLSNLDALIAALTPRVEFGKMPATPSDKVLDTVKAAVDKIAVK